VWYVLAQGTGLANNLKLLFVCPEGLFSLSRAGGLVMAGGEVSRWIFAHAGSRDYERWGWGLASCSFAAILSLVVA
jgi:hypothetical protein